MNMCLHQMKIKKMLLVILSLCLIIMVAYATKNRSMDIEAEIIKINQYIKEGDYNKCIKKYKKLLKTANKKGTEKDIILIYCNLSSCYRLKGELDMAEHYLREAQQISEKINLKDYPIDIIYQVYAQIEDMKKNHQGAVRYFLEALKWRITIYGEDSKEVGLIYTQLALAIYH